MNLNFKNLEKKIYKNISFSHKEINFFYEEIKKIDSAQLIKLNLMLKINDFLKKKINLKKSKILEKKILNRVIFLLKKNNLKIY